MRSSHHHHHHHHLVSPPLPFPPSQHHVMPNTQQSLAGACKNGNDHVATDSIAFAAVDDDPYAGLPIGIAATLRHLQRQMERTAASTSTAGGDTVPSSSSIISSSVLKPPPQLPPQPMAAHYQHHHSSAASSSASVRTSTNTAGGLTATSSPSPSLSRPSSSLKSSPESVVRTTLSASPAPATHVRRSSLRGGGRDSLSLSSAKASASPSLPSTSVYASPTRAAAEAGGVTEGVGGGRAKGCWSRTSADEAIAMLMRMRGGVVGEGDTHDDDDEDDVKDDDDAESIAASNDRLDEGLDANFDGNSSSPLLLLRLALTSLEESEARGRRIIETWAAEAMGVHTWPSSSSSSGTDEEKGPSNKAEDKEKELPSPPSSLFAAHSQTVRFLQHLDVFKVKFFEYEKRIHSLSEALKQSDAALERCQAQEQRQSEKRNEEHVALLMAKDTAFWEMQTNLQQKLQIAEKKLKSSEKKVRKLKASEAQRDLLLAEFQKALACLEKDHMEVLRLQQEEKEGQQHKKASEKETIPPASAFFDNSYHNHHHHQSAASHVSIGSGVSAATTSSVAAITASAAPPPEPIAIIKSPSVNTSSVAVAAEYDTTTATMKPILNSMTMNPKEKNYSLMISQLQHKITDLEKQLGHANGQLSSRQSVIASLREGLGRQEEACDTLVNKLSVMSEKAAKMELEIMEKDKTIKRLTLQATDGRLVKRDTESLAKEVGRLRGQLAFYKQMEKHNSNSNGNASHHTAAAIASNNNRCSSSGSVGAVAMATAPIAVGNGNGPKKAIHKPLSKQNEADEGEVEGWRPSTTRNAAKTPADEKPPLANTTKSAVLSVKKTKTADKYTQPDRNANAAPRFATSNTTRSAVLSVVTQGPTVSDDGFGTDDDSATSRSDGDEEEASLSFLLQ